VNPLRGSIFESIVELATGVAGGRAANSDGGRKKSPEVREVRIYVEIRAIGTQPSSLFRGLVRVKIRRLEMDLRQGDGDANEEF